MASDYQRQTELGVRSLADSQDNDIDDEDCSERAKTKPFAPVISCGRYLQRWRRTLHASDASHPHTPRHREAPMRSSVTRQCDVDLGGQNIAVAVIYIQDQLDRAAPGRCDAWRDFLPAIPTSTFRIRDVSKCRSNVRFPAWGVAHRFSSATIQSRGTGLDPGSSDRFWGYAGCPWASAGFARTCRANKDFQQWRS